MAKGGGVTAAALHAHRSPLRQLGGHEPTEAALVHGQLQREIALFDEATVRAAD